MLGYASVSNTGQELIGRPGTFTTHIYSAHPSSATLGDSFVNPIIPHIAAGNVWFPYHNQTRALNLQKVKGRSRKNVNI